MWLTQGCSAQPPWMFGNRLNMSSLSDEQQSPRSRHVKTTVATITIVFSSFSNDLFQPALDKLIACKRLGTHYATECDLPSGRM